MKDGTLVRIGAIGKRSNHKEAEAELVGLQGYTRGVVRNRDHRTYKGWLEGGSVALGYSTYFFCGCMTLSKVKEGE